MTMLARGPGGTGAALPAGATTGQVLQWNGSAWVAATPSASGTTPNATAAAPGLVQLAGDLAGTASAPTVPALTGKADKAALAAVATSGVYTDLTGRPALATVATSGAYTDLTGRPALAAVATSGAYTDLTARPALATVATTGSYGDLTGAPAAPIMRGKATNTSTTLTAAAFDPDLQASVTVGTYAFEAYLTGSTSTANTVQVSCPAGSASLTPSTSTSGPVSINTAITNINNVTRIQLGGFIVVTTAGVTGIQTATTTAGNAAGFGAGSWMRLTKVA